MRKRLTFVLLFFALLHIVAQTNKRFPVLDLQNASLQAVFQFLAETGNINIILDPAVKGNVTMRLRDISWQDVMDVVLDTYGLIAIKEKNYIRVMYKTDYFKNEVAQKQYEEQRRELEELETKVIRINYATANEIASSVQGVLSSRGSVTVDQRTNSIIVRDIHASFAKVDALIAELDKPTKQIRISAKIMLIDSNYLNELGIRWSAEKMTEQPGGRLTVSSEANLVATKLASFTWGIISGEYNLSASIAAIISNNKGTIVDHPEIITLDNKTATIYSGERIPINTLDEAGNVVTTFFETGTKLEVTPHITAENRILMHLKPERSAYNPTAGGFTIITRNAETNLLVGDKETVVIGGLTSQETQHAEKGVPILKDIPLIGRLFRYNSKSVISKDLVILITPEILPEAGGATPTGGGTLQPPR